MFPLSWNAAVLCAAGAGGGGGCDHLGCNSGPFLVVFVGACSDRILSCVFSSEAGAWGKLASFRHSGKGDLKLERSALVGDALHFVIRFPAITGILKYDLAKGKRSVMPLPPAFDTPPHILLMTTEDHGLAFATIRQFKLYLWSREDSMDMDEGWDQSRVNELETLLPTDALSISPHLVGFEDSTGVIFLGTKVGYFSIDLKTSRVRKVLEDMGFFGVFPFSSFYTPALGAASKDERPGEGESTALQG